MYSCDSVRYLAMLQMVAVAISLQKRQVLWIVYSSNFIIGTALFWLLPTNTNWNRYDMKVAPLVSWTRVLFSSSTFHSATVRRFLALSVLAEVKKLNPAGQGPCCIFPTLSTRSNGSWDDHLLFFLSTKLLGVGLKIVERTDEGQIKYRLGMLRFTDSNHGEKLYVKRLLRPVLLQETFC